MYTHFPGRWQMVFQLRLFVNVSPPWCSEVLHESQRPEKWLFFCLKKLECMLKIKKKPITLIHH
jgi:hypothetical protein